MQIVSVRQDSTYGIDCNKDARFRKKEKGLYDNLMEYYKKDGSFSHLLDGDSNLFH